MQTTILAFLAMASTAFAGYYLAIMVSFSPYWIFSPYWGGAIATGTLAAVFVHLYLPRPKKASKAVKPVQSAILRLPGAKK